VAAGEDELQLIVLDALVVPCHDIIGGDVDEFGDIGQHVETSAPADAVDSLEASG
jgi:hypothetical protein